MKITRAKLVTKQRLGLPLELKVKVSIYKHKNRRQKNKKTKRDSEINYGWTGNPSKGRKKRILGTA